MQQKVLIEKEVKNEQLQRFNVTDAAIAEMSANFMPLTVTGLDDKEGFKAVHDARMIVKNKRIEVEKVRKDLNADALKWQKTVNEEAKRITALLEPIETHLEAEEDKIEKEKERIQKEKERLEQERINACIANLIAAGCMYDGKSYSFAHLTIDALQIKLMDDQPFAEFMSTILIQKEQEDAKRAEEERLKEEERQRLKAEREALDKAKREQEERENKFREDQERARQDREEKERALKAEQDRIANEAAELRKKKENARVDQLAEIGLSQYDFQQQSFVFQDVNIAMVELKTLNDTEWDALLCKAAPIVIQRKKEEEERKVEELRKQQEAAAEKARQDVEEKQKQEREEKEKTDREAKEEAERQEALRPDKEKLQALANGIPKIALPQVTGEGAQQIVNDVQVMLGKIQTHILNKIKTL